MIDIDADEENAGIDKIFFEERVSICFKERMEQILTDPRGLGPCM